MNILLLRQYNPYTENGASANRIRGLVDGLCAEGHNVTIATVGGILRKGEKMSFKSSDDGLRIEYLSYSNHYGYLMSRLNTYFFDNSINLWGIGHRFRKLLKQKYDIVWLTTNITVMRLYRRYNKFITECTFVELNEFNDICEPKGNFLQRQKVSRSNRLFLDTIGKIDLLGVMTQTLIAHYKTMAKSEAKFLHLPMTVDFSRFKETPTYNEYKKPYIAFTGTMSNNKDGVDVLIKAFARIASDYPDYQLYLAGFWHYDVPMQDELIANYGLQERIHRIGVLSREQIPVFIGNATLLVLSRPDSRQAQGGFPTKLGEYLATGKPVCVTRVGEIPDYLEDNMSAFMAEPGDVDSFAEAMNRALCDNNNACRVGANGQKVAEKEFNALTQAHKLSVFFKENVK